MLPKSRGFYNQSIMDNIIQVWLKSELLADLSIKGIVFMLKSFGNEKLKS